MMLNLRWTQFAWAILFAALVSTSVAQTATNLNQDSPNELETLEVVQLLTKALREGKADEPATANAITKALEFIQRNQLNRQNQLNNWNNAVGQWENFRAINQAHAYLADQLQPSPYWIGVQSEAANEYSLKLENSALITGKGGLLITTVTEDSPAEEAGLKVNDVILRFNEMETNELAHLVAAIKANTDAPASLLIVRDQDVVTMQVTPRLRETQEESDPNFRRAELADAWVEIYGKTLAEDVEASVRFSRDGVKEIKFYKGGNTMSADADELQELPLAYRGFAQSVVGNLENSLKLNNDGSLYLSYTPKHYQWDTKFLPQYVPGAAWSYYKPFETDQPVETVDQRLEKLEEQLRKLTEAIHELKKD